MTVDIANKLYRFTGISVQSWLNMQALYDEIIQEGKNDEELIKEKEIYK